MAKNRKTKKDKLRTAQRVVSESSSASFPEQKAPESAGLFTFVSSSGVTLSPRTVKESTFVIDLKHDLLRTSIVIGAIILAELILYFTLISR